MLQSAGHEHHPVAHPSPCVLPAPLQHAILQAQQCSLLPQVLRGRAFSRHLPPAGPRHGVLPPLDHRSELGVFSLSPPPPFLGLLSPISHTQQPTLHLLFLPRTVRAVRLAGATIQAIGIVVHAAGAMLYLVLELL